MSKQWTPEEEEKLKRLVKNCKGYKEIALLLNRTTLSISNKCFKLKLQSNNENKYNKQCPQCNTNNNNNNSIKICIHCGYKFDKECISFAEEYPELLNEWDYEKNIINPKNITSGSNKRVWWKCKLGHSWDMPICDRNKNKKCNCPYCTKSPQRILIGFNDLLTTHPELCTEWNYDKNNIQPTEITFSSNKKVWWRCILGHEWCVSPNTRTNSKTGCPYCSNRKILQGYNDIATTHPKILEDWDLEKNKIKPTEISYGSHKKIWWKCKLGHSYQQSIHNKISQNQGCPYCSNQRILIGFNDIQTTNPYLLNEWDFNKNIIKPTEISYGSNKKIWWKCSANHSYQQSIVNKISQNQGCPKCKESQGEKKTLNILDKYDIKYEKEKCFAGCKNKRLLRFDFYLPKYNICIEYQGIQHYPEKYNSSHFYRTNRHNTINIEQIQKRDQIKRKFCQQNNIRLLEIPYWEQNNIEEILVKELNLVV